MPEWNLRPDYASDQRRYAALVHEGYFEDPERTSLVRVCVTPHWHKLDPSVFLRLFGEVTLLTTTRDDPALVAGCILRYVRGYQPETEMVLVAPDCSPEEFILASKPLPYTRGGDWWGIPVEIGRTTVGEASAQADAAIADGRMKLPHLSSLYHLYPGEDRLRRWGAPSYKDMNAASEWVRQEIAAVGGLDLRWGQPVRDTRVTEKIGELGQDDERPPLRQPSLAKTPRARTGQL